MSAVTDATVMIELYAELEAARDTIKRARKLRDDWLERGHMTSAKELTAVLDGSA